MEGSLTSMELRQALWNHRGKLSALVGVGLTLLFGPGSLWEWRRSKTDELTHRLAVAEQVLNIRQAIDQRFDRAVRIRALARRLTACDPNGLNYEVENRLAALDKRMNLVLDDLKHSEDRLAALEVREARMFTPPVYINVLRSVEIEIDTLVTTLGGKKIAEGKRRLSPAEVESVLVGEGNDTMLTKCPPVDDEEP